jgi:hypothetical protein
VDPHSIAPTDAVVAAVRTAVESNRFRWSDEDDVQEALAQLLTDVGARREVVLSGRDRVDLLVGRVGVEVKVDGAPNAVARQLQRYAASPAVDHLVLVTSVARHRALPDTIGGKPLTVMSLLGNVF